MTPHKRDQIKKKFLITSKLTNKKCCPVINNNVVIIANSCLVTVQQPY